MIAFKEGADDGNDMNDFVYWLKYRCPLQQLPQSLFEFKKHIFHAICFVCVCMLISLLSGNALFVSLRCSMFNNAGN